MCAFVFKLYDRKYKICGVYVTMCDRKQVCILTVCLCLWLQNICNHVRNVCVVCVCSVCAFVCVSGCACLDVRVCVCVCVFVRMS